MPFVVLYDACVLYPAPLRDLLIRLARTGLFQAKWTDKILDESLPPSSARGQILMPASWHALESS
jgi:hypothetical protein